MPTEQLIEVIPTINSNRISNQTKNVAPTATKNKIKITCIISLRIIIAI